MDVLNLIKTEETFQYADVLNYPDEHQILYLCNGKRCPDGYCGACECKHTHKIEYAKNKDKLYNSMFKKSKILENVLFVEC